MELIIDIVRRGQGDKRNQILVTSCEFLHKHHQILTYFINLTKLASGFTAFPLGTHALFTRLFYAEQASMKPTT